MIKDGNYYTVLGWMRTRLGLKGDEATVYAIVYGFSQDKENEYNLGVAYIADWLGESEQTARRVLRSLCEKGFLASDLRNGKTTAYRCVPLTNCNPLQIVTPYKLSPLPNCKGSALINSIRDNNIINNKEVVVVERADAREETTTTTTTSIFEDFNLWWQEYGTPEWEAQKEECLKYWTGLSAEDQERVHTHTQAFAPTNINRPANKRKQPYYYLIKDKTWKNDICTLGETKIHVLSGIEAEREKKLGHEVWNCELPQGYGAKFGFVLKNEAIKYKLKLNWEF